MACTCVLLADPSATIATLPAGSGPFGAPRPWEGGMGVGPYSVVNLRTGHVLTTLHIVSWGGTGGGLSFNLYHNSPNDNSGLVVTPDMEKAHDPSDPITEPIWRTSFSSSLRDDGNIELTRDDGTIDIFTEDEGDYIPPPGVFDTMVKLAEPDADGVQYILTSKHQSVARYNDLGWLLSVSDASGNTITCQYDNGVLISVTDATLNDGLSRPGRKLEFTCDNEGRLETITDPQYAPSGSSPTGREWVLHRSSVNQAFIELTDPLNHDINIGYDLHGRITSLSDKNSKVTTFGYSDAKLVDVNDPSPLTSDVNFTYTDTGSGTSKTDFTDRKNKVWTYSYSADDNLVSLTNPLTKTWSAAYTATEPQLLHHATSVTNPLSNTWAMEWDEMGNLETTTDPLGHVTERTYDGLNNLTSITPPLDNEGELNTEKTVTIEYEDEFNPTLPTKIIEPSADGVEDPAETIISYHHSDGPLMSDPAENGKVERVTDPNGVQTVFEYDDWGQPATERENPMDFQDINYADMFWTTTMDASGHTTGGSSPFNGGGRGCSTIQTDAGGNQYSTACTACAAFYVPGAPAGPLAAWTSTASHDNMGRPLSATREVEDMQHLAGFSYEQSERTYGTTYDAVGRPTAASITTDEPGFNLTTPALTVTRIHGVTYNDSTGTTTYTGPDGEAIVTTTDDCSRTYQVSRTLPSGRILSTTYVYDDAGQVDTVTNGNNTTTKYIYDNAGRVDTVTHRRGTSGPILLKQEYEWSPDGLLLMVLEYDSASPTSGVAEAVIYYDYDNRNRLISEERVDYGGSGVDAVEYHLEYTYDLGGNRLTKTDVLNEIATFYRYDVSEENDGGVDENQHNNRLLYYNVHTTGSFPATMEEGWYHYGAAGHVNRFIKWKASDGMRDSYKRVHAYAFHYNKAGQLWIAVSMRGELGIGSDPDTESDNYAELAKHYDLPEGSVLQNVVGVAAMEYRYDDSGRQRCLVRPRTPDENLQPIGGANAGTWHDYVGDERYNDYDITFIPEASPEPASLEVADRRSYLSGVGYDDVFDVANPTNQPVYEQGDQIGTTRRLVATDNEGDPAVAPLLARSTYTGFGEVVDHTPIGGVDAPASFRHGYAGAWGYQAGDPDTVTVDATGFSYWPDVNGDIIAPADPMTELGWLHVGERYYDPACGRFVMRDPIGIDGGLNCYEYSESNPVSQVDPDGMSPLPSNWPTNWNGPIPRDVRRLERWLKKYGRRGVPGGGGGSGGAGGWARTGRVLLAACTSIPALVVGAGVCGVGVVVQLQNPRSGSTGTDGIGESLWEWFWPPAPAGYRPY